MSDLDRLLHAALAAHRGGALDEAADRYQDVLQREPAHVGALHMLGMVHHQRGDTDQALACLDRALAQAPADATVLANRSAVHLGRGDADAAERDARRAVESNLEAFAGWMNLGLALSMREREADAAHAFREASRRRPDHPAALLRWFTSAGRGTQPAGVRERLRQPLPALAAERELALGAAAALEQAGQASAAAALLARLRAECPGDLLVAERLDDELRYRRACELESERRSDDAMAAAGHLLRRAPAHRGARLLRAELARETGDIESALAEHARLAQDHPHDSIAASSRLITLQHAPSVGAADLAAEHRAWARRFAEQPLLPATVPSPAEATRELRVGWLSARFSAGIVESFFARTLEAMGSAGLAHVLYDNGSLEDAANARFRAAALAHHRVEGLDDVELCERIRADRIDVLVELGGHGPGNRLRALSRRPAPVQISWLDYFHSTGLDAIDVLLTDAQLSPPELAAHYSERLHRMPSGRLCYAPAVDFPSPASRESGPLRFASFNRLAKLNDGVLALWGRLLAVYPEAVLRLKAGALDDGQMRRHFLARCARAGLDAARLELSGRGTHRETLEAYADVDVALDPYPFSGCATSADALAMGVPVVTMMGETMASRQTASLLVGLGLEECIATDAGGYVACVRRLVEAPARRAALRQALPGRARATAEQVSRHAGEVAAGIRAAWVRACAGADPA